MVQLFPGLWYVIITTAVFTVLLVSLTAVSLLSQARAIARHRYVGSVFSKKNVKKVVRLRPRSATLTAVLLNVRDVETDRLLTVAKRPALLRLYEGCLYIRPYLSSAAYLVRTADIDVVSVVDDSLAVTFIHAGRKIILQLRTKHVAKWHDALNVLISNHK